MSSAPSPPSNATRRDLVQTLRSQVRLALRSPETGAPRVVPTGLPDLDGVLRGGGLPRGHLTLVQGSGQGATSLLHRTAASATRAGTVAWLDGAGRLYPPALRAAGADLAEVMIVWATGPLLARTVAILTRAEAVDLLVCDVPEADAHLVQRLARLARFGETALVLLTERALVVSGEVGLWLEVRRVGWDLQETGVHLEVVARRQRGGAGECQARVTIAYPIPLPPVLEPGGTRVVTSLPGRGGRVEGAVEAWHGTG